MASKSVPTTEPTAPATTGSKHDLWITERNVLTITIDKASKDFPADVEQCSRLNSMIQGLARAAKSVSFNVQESPEGDAGFVMQPIEDIADAIILLVQLSEAIRIESSQVQA